METTTFQQNVIIMRHGDRLDNFDPLWVKTADKPWDPPLVIEGRVRAYQTGLELRDSLGFPLHRVFVSPFLRCVETASEVVSALCSVGDGSHVDQGEVKISIEYGLCEMLNETAIRPASRPKDGEFPFNMSELEAILPAGTINSSEEKIYPQMLSWGESVSAARERYVHAILSLADKYPAQNLLLITHGEGVQTSISRFSTHLKDSDVYKLDYCAYLHVRRPVDLDKSGSYTSGSFRMVSIEYGLCEVLNEVAIKPESAPKDGVFSFNMSELEAMLPAGTIDTSFEKIYPQMPGWGESILDSRARYVQMIQTLADKYPSENLLIVTHGEGVRASVSRLSTNLKDSDVHHVNYCAYSHVKRPVTIGESGSYTFGSYQMLTVPHKTGIDFSLPDAV